MKRTLTCLALLSFCGATVESKAQDPRFSQFFASPMSLNPALTANIDGPFRLAANVRQQWRAMGSPFTTAGLSFEHGLFRQSIPEYDRSGMGVMLMQDQAPGVGLKSIYASLSFAYHKALDENQRFGIGFQGTYGNRSVNPALLTYHNQFEVDRFNTSLPSGEQGMQPLPATIGMNAGMLYQYEDADKRFYAGASLYHLNRPRQTMLYDSLNRMPSRVTVHAGATILTGSLIRISAHSIWQTQAKASEFSIGGAVGYDLGEIHTIYAGSWYRYNESIYPYISYVAGPIQVALSYDFTVSTLKGKNPRYSSLELSFVLNGPDNSFQRKVMPWYY
jgi:type IX secretion system PorP/SprF family membrane protein